MTVSGPLIIWIVIQWFRPLQDSRLEAYAADCHKKLCDHSTKPENVQKGIWTSSETSYCFQVKEKTKHEMPKVNPCFI